MYLFPAIKKYDNKTYQQLENFSNKVEVNRYNLYTSVKSNKYKTEMIPVTLARRLLRTKRTLILPAHVNLTLITNSYDVVHSWFIPGLGLKMDCVPGRSTHHSLYIDNIGFYYGQCAEICGRYHHHMPIRVCALSFEHFML
jgi:heme/copper-type cytochrome/quinol oxidase subunit 2